METSARELVWEAVEALLEKYKHDGHSLGCAPAILCAYDFAESGVNVLSNSPSAPTGWHFAERSPEAVLLDEDGRVRKDRLKQFANAALHVSDTEGDSVNETKNLLVSEESANFPAANNLSSDRIPITLNSFGRPKLGDQDFVNRVQQQGVAVLRVVNIQYKVPRLPGYIHRKLNGFVCILSPYEHVGVELQVDNEISEDLRSPAGIRRPLHLIDKYQDIGKLYEKTFRDYAHVNKHHNFLEPELSIPHCWWQG